jgi:outer membrane protein assembly factor BamD (BamD/ComL family)
MANFYAEDEAVTAAQSLIDQFRKENPGIEDTEYVSQFTITSCRGSTSQAQHIS